MPIVGGSSVERDGVRFMAPGSRDDDGLELHWSEAPWIAAGEDELRIDNLDGRAAAAPSPNGNELVSAVARAAIAHE